MKIIISGRAGSGKSAVGKKLSEVLGYDFVSAGNKAREFAKDVRGMDIHEFQKACRRNPEYDISLDKYYASFGATNDDFVIDYRLGYHFIPDAFRVMLIVSEDTAARRVFNAAREDEFPGMTIDQVKRLLCKRNRAMRARFIKLYQQDYECVSNYHLMINVDERTIDEIVNILCSTLEVLYKTKRKEV